MPKAITLRLGYREANGLLTMAIQMRDEIEVMYAEIGKPRYYGIAALNALNKLASAVYEANLTRPAPPAA